MQGRRRTPRQSEWVRKGWVRNWGECFIGGGVCVCVYIRVRVSKFEKEKKSKERQRKTERESSVDLETELDTLRVQSVTLCWRTLIRSVFDQRDVLKDRRVMMIELEHLMRIEQQHQQH